MNYLYFILFSFIFNLFFQIRFFSFKTLTFWTKRALYFSHSFFLSTIFSNYAYLSLSSSTSSSFSLYNLVNYVAWINWVACIFNFFFNNWIIFSFSVSIFFVTSPLLPSLSMENKSHWSFLICCWYDWFSTFSWLYWFSILLFVDYSLDTLKVDFNTLL